MILVSHVPRSTLSCWTDETTQSKTLGVLGSDGMSIADVAYGMPPSASKSAHPQSEMHRNAEAATAMRILNLRPNVRAKPTCAVLRLGQAMQDKPQQRLAQAQRRVGSALERGVRPRYALMLALP